ncbi:Holliday junction branch migration protein RuvA [Actinotignum sp. GS-2025f]|uniref:Holliday junction branch migration protein RuvA n=1 Tax=unclassified Actinotignum TaxID=2632702 RepID=UPI002A7FF455|nr:Holliday junction branch migration protein RuvA [Actinotignum sp. SLA_B059]MDY5127155.1 Holliday junction branch migration protein RuvA [Actinotignum sp. SLA_B059]
MIASIRGTVSRVTTTFAVVEVGGWGVKVFATPDTLARLREGAEAFLYTSLVASRDDLPSLYGFSEADERDVYDIMQTVSGIGAKVALALLSVHTPNALRAAVQSKDEAALTRVPGIGKKSAQRIILELGNKLGPAPVAAGETATAGADPDAVVAGLVGLGWKESDAVAAYEEARAQVPQGTVAQLLRASLQILGARR